MYPKLIMPEIRSSNMDNDTSAALNSTLAVATIGIATLNMLEILLPVAAQEVARSSQELTHNFRILMQYIESGKQPPRDVSDAISHIITNMQFEDRNTQIMENVVSILERYRSMLEDISRNIEGMQEGSPATGHNIAQAIESILSSIRLGDIRARYLDALKKANVAHEGSDNASTEESNSSVVELF